MDRTARMLAGHRKDCAVIVPLRMSKSWGVLVLMRKEIERFYGSLTPS